MICSTAELGLGRRRQTASSCSTRTPPRPVTTRSRCSGWATRSSTSRSTPTAPTPCRCAGRHATPRWRSACRSPTRPTSSVTGDGRGLPRHGRRSRSAARSSPPARSRAFDPTRPTPDWMARRIEQAGMRSISLAVDITNYVMLELGQPIHGYRPGRAAGPDRRPTGTEGEQLTTLDGVVRTLDRDDRLITTIAGRSASPASWAAQRSSSPRRRPTSSSRPPTSTRATIARTARLHKLPSEASKRFERGVDPTLPARAGTAGREPARRARSAARSSPVSRSSASRRRRVPPSACRSSCPRASRASTSTPRTPSRRWRPTAATVALRPRVADRHAADLAARPHRPLRPRRRGAACRRLRPGARRSSRPPRQVAV